MLAFLFWAVSKIKKWSIYNFNLFNQSTNSIIKVKILNFNAKKYNFVKIFKYHKQEIAFYLVNSFINKSYHNELLIKDSDLWTF